MEMLMIKWQRLATRLSIMAQSRVIEVGTGRISTQRMAITQPRYGVIGKGGQKGFLKEEVPGKVWKSKWQIEQRRHSFGRGCTIEANPSEATASGSALLTPLFWSQNFL